jgi:hypothetical protein
MNFNDWGDIDIGSLQAVEALARAKIMMGDNNSNFNPKSGLTRAEMAQIIRNMDDIYYNMYNISKKSGTVGGIKDNVSSETGAAAITTDYYVRGADGTVDTLTYGYSENNPGRNLSGMDVMDAVVFKNGSVGGLSALVEGDQIEYLVDNTTEEVLYVETLSAGPVVSEIEGRLQSVNLENGTVIIENESGIGQVYPMMSGVYGEDFVVIDQRNNNEGNLPLGSNVKLRLLNDTVESMSFIGNPVLIQETRGIVVENNPDFGYITFVDNNGQLVTKNYYADSITVEKQQYYDADDEIGYIDEVFPNFEYDARDVYIEDIEAGDIIFVRYDPNDNSIISNLSASTNYVAKYGKISQITRGEGVSRYLVEYENNQTSWFDVADNIFVSRVGRPVAHGDIKVGDWAKFLVNQAIIQPGYIVESIKEINIEGEEHFITNIVKGQLAGIEPIQRQLIVQNAQVLGKTGWSDYHNLQQINIASNDIEYYYNGERISLDYAERYLKRADGEVYIAMENAASGERARMITFRMGRDELLNADTIIASDGSGTFSMLSNAGDIATDTGTIVRRNGRLVSNNNILPSDYSVVSLNGGNTAAVVDISDTPGTENVYIARGRILSVDQGENFKVQSMSVLSGGEWVYTPVQREFAIDYDTLFITADGVGDINTLRDYTADSAVNKVYNIIYDGSRATRVIDSPYANLPVKGTIYETDGETLSLRNAQYYDDGSGKWVDLSLVNATMTVTVPETAVIVKNNAVVTAGALEAGDSLRILTDELPENMTAGMSVTGHMIFVEN